MRLAEQGESRASRRIRRGAVLAAIAAASLIAAGCGDDDAGSVEDEYVKQVQSAIRPVSEQSEDLFRQVDEARSLEDLSPPLGRTEQTYREATGDLEAIDPPDEVANLHQQLVATHEEVADAAEAAAEAAKKREGEGLKEFEEAGDRYSRRLGETTRRLSARGFDF